MTDPGPHTHIRSSRRDAIRTAIATGVSIAIHVGVVVYVGMFATAPEIDIEFQLPSEVEFGLTEGMTVESGPPAGAPGALPEPDPTAAEAGGEGGPDAGVPDAGVADAGPADAGVDAGALVASTEDEGADGTGEEGPAAAGGEGEGDTRIPPGAQIALRLDMARIRESRLAPDVRRLLDAIPDWRILLEGSGIDPLEDLDRLLVASPDLQREGMMLAGRFTGGIEEVRQAVASIASARGVDAPWRTEGGVQVAPWADQDATEREIAIVGPQHFIITRPEDRPRLLAVARARAARDAEEGAETAGSRGGAAEGTHGTEGTDDPSATGEGQASEGTASDVGPDALLSMPEDVAVSLEVEGARRFMQGPRGVPTRLSLTLVEHGGGRRASLAATGVYDTPSEAEDARAFWDRIREQYADNLLVAMAGMGTPLRRLELEATGDRVEARTELNEQQMRLVLSYVQGQLEALARRRDRRLPTPSDPSRP